MADTLDLLTLAEGYTAINDSASALAGTGPYDTRLAQMITAVSRRVDDKCGPVVQRTISGEEHPRRQGRDLGNAIYLRYRPVASVTTITEYVGTSPQVLTAENFPTVTGNDYRLVNNGLSGVVERRNSGYPWAFAAGSQYGRVIVTYVAGRYASTAAVDAKFKEAAAAILLRLWKRGGGPWAGGSDPFTDSSGIGFFRAVDPMIAEFLAEEMLLRNYA